MAIKKFTEDGVWNTSVPAASDKGYRTLKYSGSLGGGTLSIHTLSHDMDPDSNPPAAIETPVSDAKLKPTTLDDNGDLIRQITFQSSGTVIVKLTGSAAPTAKVMVE
jgi:hypothetical protein